LKTSNTFRPQCEALDHRVLPSITLSNGLLDVGGTTGNDDIVVRTISDGSLKVVNNATGESRTFNLGNVTSIKIRAGDG